MELRDKKVIIFGLARSGVGAANLLASLGCEVTVTDKKSAEELGQYAQQLLPSVKLSLGSRPLHLNGADMIVLSPGVPPDIEPVLRAREKEIKIVGELEIAYQAVNSLHPAPDSPPKFLAITGTNGKSTTTMLLDLMMNKAGFSTMLGGNIGKALSEEIYKAAASGSNKSPLTSFHLPVDYIVAEVSSFQLESIDDFKPKGAAVLNITPDHLDRYHSLDEYREAKAAISRNQGEDDFLVLNADDAETMKLYDASYKMRGAGCPRICFFSRLKKVEGVYLKDGFLRCNLANSGLRTPDFRLLPAEEIRIKGVHNLENAMASSAMALLAGCPPDAAADALREFIGLEHRMEFVRVINGVKYVNDSKGTNIGAVQKSIEGFSEPIVLIAGGRDKAGDFGLLKPLIKEKVRALVLLGEAADKMRSVFGGLVETVVVSGLYEAVQKAREMAVKGDVVLLSPACASFDMFRDFEDRGQQFKNIVRGLS